MRSPAFPFPARPAMPSPATKIRGPRNG